MTAFCGASWEGVQIRTNRSLRMPRARGGSRRTLSDRTDQRPLMPHPVSVIACAATIDLCYSLDDANVGIHADLRVFAGAPFDDANLATGVLSKVLGNSRLEKQLNSLSADFKEDFGDALDKASVAGLRLFLRAYQDVVTPQSISADSKGRVEATWEGTDGQSASLKFLDEEKIQYALVLQSPRGRTRPWGTASTFGVFVARPEMRAILGEGSAPPVSAP